MFDRLFRVFKEPLLSPAASMLQHVHPTSITLTALIAGLCCAVACATGHSKSALLLWAVNRTLDGLDGVVARRFRKTSDLGAYIDIVCDFVIYALVPISLVFAQCSKLDQSSATMLWMQVSLLEGLYFVNAGGLFYLAAILEMRKAGAAEQAEYTSVTMPEGLIEGTETVVMYSLFVALPRYLHIWFGVFGIGVAITICQRVVWSIKHLPRLQERRTTRKHL